MRVKCAIERRLALPEFRTLITAGTSNPKVYGLAANALLHQAVPKKSLESRFPDATGEVHLWCNQVLALEPHYATANETLARADALAGPVAPHESIMRTINL